jgi:hypothetical protein
MPIGMMISRNSALAEAKYFKLRAAQAEWMARNSGACDLYAQLYQIGDAHAAMVARQNEQRGVTQSGVPRVPATGAKAMKPPKKPAKPMPAAMKKGGKGKRGC